MKYLLYIGIYLLIHTYLVLRTGAFLKKFSWSNKVIHIIFYIGWVLFATFPIFGAFLPKAFGLYTFMKYGNIFLGFFVYYIMIFIVGDIILQFFRKDKERYNFISKIVLCCATAGSLIINVYGTLHAQDPTLITYDITLNESKGRDLKIALLGDLHLSVNSNVNLIKKVVEMINAEQVDLVLIAGDVFTSTYDGLKDPELYSTELAKMESTYGTYVVYGNHDVDETLFGGFSLVDPTVALRPETMEEFMFASMFNMLGDEIETIEELGIQIVGRIDGEKNGTGSDERMTPEELLQQTNDEMVQIVLEHEPWEFEDLAKNGADLVLCGHTHSGQIFPGNLFVSLFNDNGWGYKELYGIPTVVTAGVGYYGPPIRVGTDSEVTIINFNY